MSVNSNLKNITTLNITTLNTRASKRVLNNFKKVIKNDHLFRDILEGRAIKSLKHRTKLLNQGGQVVLKKSVIPNNIIAKLYDDNGKLINKYRQKMTGYDAMSYHNGLKNAIKEAGNSDNKVLTRKEKIFSIINKIKGIKGSKNE